MGNALLRGYRAEAKIQDSWISVQYNAISSISQGQSGIDFLWSKTCLSNYAPDPMSGTIICSGVLSPGCTVESNGKVYLNTKTRVPHKTLFFSEIGPGLHTATILIYCGVLKIYIYIIAVFIFISLTSDWNLWHLSKCHHQVGQTKNLAFVVNSSLSLPSTSNPSANIMFHHVSQAQHLVSDVE